jgi:hypothetical protein
MNKDYSFLPHFLTENIYVVKENFEAYSIGSKSDGFLSSTHSKELSSIETIQKNPENITSKMSMADSSTASSPALTLPLKGKNLKGILIAVEDYDNEYINAGDEAFLLKILAAVKLSPEDVAILNTAGISGDQVLLINEISYDKFILFGVTKAIVPDEIPNYSISTIYNKRILKADGLKDIQEDQTKKLKLWENLKMLF